MKGFSFKIERESKKTTVFLKGGLTEGIKGNLSSLHASIGQKCTFNFSQVTNANSLGVAEWTLFIQEFGKDREIIYEACSSSVVTTMNLLPAFVNNARVVSIFAFFECSECKDQTQLCVTLGEDVSNSGSLIRTQACPACGDRLHLLHTDDGYFDFLSYPRGN